MAQYTPNYGLSMPDATDNFSDFRESYNENLEIIDENMGGGGGASALEDLSDVNITNPTDGQVLKYDATNDEWINADESGGGSTPDVRLFEALTYAEVKASGSPTSAFTVNDNVLTSTASRMSDSETNILSTDTIDLTYVNLIEITLHSATFYSGGNWNGFFYVCDNDTGIRNNTYPSVSHKILFSNTSTPVKYFFDVSQLTGNWYVGVCTGGHTNLVVDAVAIGTGSGGHTIIDENGTEMTQRKGLQFIGNVSVSDDSAHDKTIINISGDSVQYIQILDHGTRVGQMVINGVTTDINVPTVMFYPYFLNGDFIGGLSFGDVMFQLYSRKYVGGDGIEVNQLQTGEGEISLEYLKVVDGAVNLVFDDGN